MTDLRIIEVGGLLSATVGPPRHGELRLLAALGRMIKTSAMLTPGTSHASCCGCMCMYQWFALVVTGAVLARRVFMCGSGEVFHCFGVRLVHLVLVFLGLFRFSRRARGRVARGQVAGDSGTNL